METSESVSALHPWLAIRCRKDNTYVKEEIIFFNISENRCYRDIIPEEKVILTSFRGWLMLKDDNDSSYSYLWNPITKKRFELPFFESHGRDIHYVLTSSPLDSDCRVMCISNWEQTIWFCKPGDDRFIGQESTASLYTPTLFQGRLYCVTSHYQLVIIDVIGEKLEFTGVMTTHKEFDVVNSLFARMENRNYLVEFQGELLHISKVFYGYSNDDVATFVVSKFDSKMDQWMRMAGIGNGTLFLSFKSGVCFIAEESTGVRKNSIYYVNKCRDRCLYVFDLEEESVSMSVPCEDIRGDFITGYEWVMMEKSTEESSVQ